MAKDQAELLREEARAPHAVFHQFVMQLNRSAPDSYFLFFEGGEDPTFYMGHVITRLDGRDYQEFVCNGRQGVLKVNELCNNDGRAFNRTIYFIDKDHCDLLNPKEVLPSQVFQTESYSFENFLVCKEIFRRFWTERLHLEYSDPRYDKYFSIFEKLHQSFLAKMSILMAIILIGRGIIENKSIKLNLNNVQLEKVISFNLESKEVIWTINSGKNFLSSSNIKASGIVIRGEEIRHVIRKNIINRNPKTYVRGKYELWFFVRFLSLLSRELADKIKAKATGLARATPGEVITHASAIDLLCGLAPCPYPLGKFLDTHIPPR